MKITLVSKSKVLLDDGKTTIAAGQTVAVVDVTQEVFDLNKIVRSITAGQVISKEEFDEYKSNQALEKEIKEDGEKKRKAKKGDTEPAKAPAPKP